MVEFCKIVTDPSESITNRRAVCWSLAHIVVQPRGESFLLNQCHFDFIATLQNMALDEDFLSLRGTALMALSFVVSNPSIRDKLTEQGWYCGVTSGNTICLPVSKQDTFYKSVTSENWLLPTCNHFRKSEAASVDGSAFTNLARGGEKVSVGGYNQTNICPSDITIVEEDVTEDEKKIIQLVRSGA